MASYTPTQVDEALLALAYCGGNTRRASSLTGVPSPTLHLWRTSTHRDRYLTLAERERPRLEQIAVEDAISTILQAGELEHSVLDHLATRLDADDPAPKELAELAATLQRITTAKGINGTKLLELTGRPTQITEHRNGTEILKQLAQRVPGLIINSTAEDITSPSLLNEPEHANAREQGSSSPS